MNETTFYPATLLAESRKLELSDSQLFKYVKLVYNFLNLLKPNSSIKLSSIVKEKNITLFVEVTKMYMDDHRLANGINFNSNYSIISKHFIHPQI
jgi:hypothetical protein